MQKLASRLVRPFKLIRGRFSEALPTQVDEFERYCDQFFPLYKLPDNDNTRFVIASMIQHLGPTQARASKHHFQICVYKFLANEMAFNFMKKLKADQAAKNKMADEAATIDFNAPKEKMGPKAVP